MKLNWKAFGLDKETIMSKIKTRYKMIGYILIYMFCIIALPINTNAQCGWISTSSTQDYSRNDSIIFDANGYLYVVSGNRSDYNYLYAQIHPDGTLSEWTSIRGPYFLLTLYNLNGLKVANNLYTLGGISYNGIGISSYHNDVYKSGIGATGPLNDFIPQSGLKTARAACSAIYSNGYIYAVGGMVCEPIQSGCLDGATNTVEYSKVSTDGSLGVWNYTSSLSTTQGFMYGIAFF